MPITLLYNGQPMNGGADDEVLHGLEVTTGTANNTINGGGGDDLILGDATSTYLEFTGNNSIGTAANIDTSGVWSTDENPLVGDPSVPYTSIYANADVGFADYYAVTVGAGETLTVDIDFGNLSPIGDSDDVRVEILDAMGNVLAFNDDGGSSAGGLGSVSGFDSYLTYLAAAGGTYYIRVRPYDAATFPAAATYVMQVSVTGHAATGGVAHGNDTLNGDTGDDTIAGQGGDDILNGGIGNDTLIGGTGTDTINGGDGNDIIYGYEDGATSTDDDVVHGDDGNDIIYSTGVGHYYGDAGDDRIVADDTSGFGEILDGGAGVDTLDLRVGNFTYVLNMFTGVTNYTDSSGELYTNFENVYTGSEADNINGNNAANDIRTNGGNDTILGRGGNDVIDAGDGNNYLNGGLGADNMMAGAGDDIYYVDNVGDMITDGGGFDLVRSTISHTLGAGLENLQLLTGNNINATGNDLDNVIWGNVGNNIIDGGLGADIMRGGNGDDTYIADNVGDRAAESNLQTGYDTVYSSVNFTLWENIERLILVGGDLNGFGNTGDNAMYGTSGANILRGNDGADSVFGNGGDDRLFGDGGDDNLQGGDGVDLLQGGADRDILTGGTGADGFIFADGDMGNSIATADRITDFSHAQGDRIRLNLSDANSLVGGDQAYTFIGTQAFQNIAGELRYQQISGNTYVYGDQDGDGNADWIVRVDGLVNLVAGDFIL